MGGNIPSGKVDPHYMHNWWGGAGKLVGAKNGWVTPKIGAWVPIPKISLGLTARNLDGWRYMAAEY